MWRLISRGRMSGRGLGGRRGEVLYDEGGRGFFSVYTLFSLGRDEEVCCIVSWEMKDFDDENRALFSVTWIGGT